MSLKQLLLIALGLLFLYGLFTVGAPFLLAIVVAIILEPANSWLMKKLKLKRVPVATATSTLFLLLLLGLVYLLGTQLIVQLTRFWERAPMYFQSAQNFILNTWNRTYGIFEDLSPDIVAGIEEFLSGLTIQLGNMVNYISSTFLGFVKELPNLLIFFIVFIVAVYLFSFKMDTLKKSILSLFEEQSQQQVSEVLLSLKKSIFGFIRAQFVFSTFTYITTLIGLLILKVEYPLAIALLVTIIDILPILGVGSALIPWACYSVLTGNLFLGVGLVILFIVITVLRKIIEPKVLGDAVGIGPLSALISLYVGFKLVGVIGFFLGPIVVLIFSAMHKSGLIHFKVKFK